MIFLSRIALRKRIRTQDAHIYSDKFVRGRISTQTGNHEGQTGRADSNITIEYESWRPWKAHKKLDGVDSRKKEPDHVVQAHTANINAKDIRGPWHSDKYRSNQKHIHADHDVEIEYVERVDNVKESVSKSKKKGGRRK